MGFYGNITNTNKTQFTFDRSYPNRAIMEERIATDSIYLGRYVLIEYDLDTHNTRDTFTRLFVKDNNGVEEFYTSDKFEEITKVKWTNIADKDNPNKGDGNAVLTGQIIYIEKDVTPDNNSNVLSTVFYKCINVPEESEVGDIAKFSLVVVDSTPYTTNYNIDTKRYGESRGYDSTVWQKVYSNNKEKFVMIAELNSVVPTFGLSADAPTMEPITPHFDADSTNVYYKLHWQPQWGLRVAEQEEGMNSDETAYWVKTTYDPVTDTTKTESIPNVPAAINFNKPAFEPYQTANKHDETNNYFTILPTGKSGHEYNTHDGTGELRQAEDIQEMRINLPAIGNMMSDAWDIIHGPNRDDSMKQVDESGKRVDSLQGRLNSIAAINGNEIPVKRLSDGKLVGTKINGDNNHLSDEIPEILNEELTTNLEEDDAWIYTKIDSNAITEDHNSGIAIHHTFHKTDNSESSINKNDNVVLQSETYKEDNLATENLTVDKDKLNLYTPYVDKAGHVVGHNIETVTLPYSYRHYQTDGVSEVTEDIYTTIANQDNGNNSSTVATDTATNMSADETQDTLLVNPGNKWIQTKFEDDKLIIAHEIHAVNTVAKTSDINSNGDTITVQDIEFDAAGHVIKNQNHTYTLPFGYKNIVTKNTEDNAVNAPASITGTQSADNTQDTLNLESSNRWIKVDNATEDTVKFGHKLATFIGETKANTHYGLTQNEDHTSNLNTDNEFEVPCFLFDEAGHILEARTHKVTLPELFTSVEIGAASGDIADTKHTAGTIVADAMTDKLTLNPGNKWIQMTANENNDSVSIQHLVKKFNETTDAIDFNNSNSESFDIQQIGWDEAGHLISSKKVTYNLPKSIKTVDVKNNGVNTVNAPTQSNGTLVAETATDTITVDTGNRWILLQADVDNDKFVISHAAAGNEATTAGDTTAATPAFGTTFNVPYVKYDEMGHIKSSDVRTVMIPKGSLTDTASNGVANVLTSIGFNDTTGAITTTHENVGTLSLTGYSLGTDVGAISAADTVNAAMSKLQAQINKEVSDRNTAIQNLDVATIATGTDKVFKSISETDGKISVETQAVSDLTLTNYNKGTSGEKINSNDTLNIAFSKLENQVDGAKAYTDQVKNALLGDGIKDTFDTLVEIQQWIEGDGVDATELAAAIAGEAKRATDEEQRIEGVINQEIADRKAITDALGSTYATVAQGAKADSALQATTTFVYGEENKTIQDLFALVSGLRAELNALKDKVDAEHPESVTPPEEGGEEVPTE